MNKSEYINPNDCGTCGKCCKTFSISYPKKNIDPIVFSEIQRFRDLDIDDITIAEQKNMFIVTFHHNCIHLEMNDNSEYRCKIYDGNRPLLCQKYPYEETVDCPHKKESESSHKSKV